MAGLPVIKTGGKGSSLSSLSSSAVYVVANSLAQVTIDSSALDRLSSSSSTTANLKPHRLLPLLPSLPSFAESRASHVVLLAKLLSISSIRTVLPLGIAAALNSNSSQDLGLETLDLTDQQARALDKLKDSSAFYGVSALLDHQLAALSRVSDVMAALLRGVEGWRGGV